MLAGFERTLGCSSATNVFVDEVKISTDWSGESQQVPQEETPKDQKKGRRLGKSFRSSSCTSIFQKSNLR